MIRTLYAMILAGLLAAMAGCSMCASPYDYSYPAYGGIVPENPCGGRVGSAFCRTTELAPVPQYEQPVAPTPY